MEKEYNYEQIYLLPNKCIVNSRNECDITVTLGAKTFNSPIIAANMKSVINEKTCRFFAKQNWFYIMHRFGTDNIKFIRKMKKDNLISSISVGVNGDSYNELKQMKNENILPEFITIDIAHGWAPKMEAMIKYIKDNFPDTFVIAGNVCTSAAVKELDAWGADAIKVGIAGGKVCITKNKTGFHRPMATTILECAKATKKDIIADGGVYEHGHVAIALSLGAKMVMCGNIFAGFDQSAGNIIEINNKLYKEYYGSASENNKGNYVHIEGRKILIEYKGDMMRFINELQDDLKSSCSYAGGRDLSALLNTSKIIC